MTVTRDRREHLRDNFSFQADNFSFLLDIFFLSYRMVFVTNFFCADSEKCIGLRKKHLRHSKKQKGYNALFG